MSKYKDTVKVRAKKELSNGFGKIGPNEICYIDDVWLNKMANDVYVRLVSSNGVQMITSINNFEIIETKEK